MSSRRSISISQILAIAGVATAVSLTGYALYFDYQRRNNPKFRRKLRNRLKEQKKQEALAKDKAKKEKLEKVKQFLQNELEKNPIPSDPTQMESVFASNVELGERLSMVAGNEMEAAAKFYKALAVYPRPTDLLGIYQRTIPGNIYELVVLMIAVMPPTNLNSLFTGGAPSQPDLGVDDEVPIVSEIPKEEQETVDADNDEHDGHVADTEAEAEAEPDTDADADADKARAQEELVDRIVQEFSEDVAPGAEGEETKVEAGEQPQTQSQSEENATSTPEPAPQD